MPTLVIVGDSPDGPTGLGRIARDLRQRLTTDPELDVDVHAIGWEVGPAWGGDDRYLGHQDTETWGARVLTEWWPAHVDHREHGIVLSIWDPARCFGLRDARVGRNARWWGYFPIDAWNVHQTIAGPPADAVSHYDRVLAYGRFGARVLQGTRAEAVPHLPHGIDPTVFYPRIGEQASWEILGEILAPTVTPRSTLIGCVATNQPRKDLGLLCQAVARLRQTDPTIKLWLHTDREVTAAWSIPQLLGDFGLSRHTVVTTLLQDWQLAACYSYCAATIAPGLGEGFGYPIIESLACGTPVVHGTYGGGTDLVPCPDWVFPERDTRLEGAYALARPVYHAEDVVNAVQRALDWNRRERQVVQEYCVGAVAHLHWDRLWPHWATWFREGLEALR